MKVVRRVLWWLGTVGFSLAGLQAAALALFFTVVRVACKPIIVGDGKAKHTMELEIELHEPANDMDELLGARLPDLGPDELDGCLPEWTDEDPIMMLNDHGPKNGTELIFWKAITLRGRTTLGRYIADLWTGVSIGSGGALGSRAAWSKVDNIRLVERMPPPQPGPPGFRAIMPGECVSGSLQEEEGRVVGRYWIDLPAPSSVGIFTRVPNETDAQLRERLTFDDVDVPEEIDPVERRPSGRLRVSHSGFHKVIIYRVDPPGAARAETTRRKNYALRVYWGKYL
jgi:hypothetical protein